MKWVLVVAAVVGVAAARTIFDYERDGLENEQKGQPGKAVTGEYEWRAPDGKVVEISYVADHLGFRLVDDPEPTATQSGATRSLGEEEDDDGGAREVRTEEETEEEEGEEESEGRSEGTEEEESESSGKERSEEPETEGAEAEEKSAEPEAEEAEAEEAEAEGQEPETKAAEAGEKSAEAEQEKADAKEEENAGAERATKKASEESADADADQEASTASAKISSVGEAVAAEAEAPEAGGESAGKQLSPETPVLVPVKVESNFDSVSPATEVPVIATAEMLPPVAPLVAPMTVESPPAPVPTAGFSFDAAHSEPVNLVPQDLVVFVIPPVEQVATLPNAEAIDVSQPMPAAAPFASAASALPVEIPQPAFTDSDFVVTEQGSADPALLLPELPLALVASPEGTNVVLEKPVVEKLEVSAPIGVPEIDADIAVIAKSSDSVQAVPQFIATDLSGSFDPVADIPASLSVIPASDFAFVPVENIPKMISFEEVVEVSPEVDLAPELPSPLPLIQLDEVDPSFVSVEISTAALPQPDTNPSSLFSADVEVRPEPQFIAPIVPPPAPLSQDAPFALLPHRFEAPKSGRSMDSVPVFVETSHAEPTNALFFVPEALQEETKGQSSDMLEIVVPADSIMTIAKSLIQPAPTFAEPIVYEETVETAEPFLAQLEFGPAPSPVGVEASAPQGSASFANAIPLSLKDETFFSAVDASPVTFDASPVEFAFVEVPAEDSFPALSEVIAQPLTETQPGVHSAFEEPVLLDVSAAADVQGPEVSPSAVAIFETDAGFEPVFEEVVMISEEPAAAGPTAQVTIITEDVPSGPLDHDDAMVLVSKSIQSPPLLPPLMKPSVILN
ncbi:calphotin-like [Penaeus chinensis]|uniref:calphotin-like n=1 Tax=Penaeus chinensis TaxID=139456 RepID=UPI001FB7AD38|nr:calphotin-like [Penaeus chinensis]